MILHQLVNRALRSAGCGFIIWASIWLVFRAVQPTHESSPVGLDDLRSAKVQELLNEDEHTGPEPHVSEMHHLGSLPNHLPQTPRPLLPKLNLRVTRLSSPYSYVSHLFTASACTHVSLCCANASSITPRVDELAF